MMEEFDLGTKHPEHFRLEDWLFQDLMNYMEKNQINSKTQALHDYVSFLKNRIEEQRKEIAELKRAQRSYVQEKRPAAQVPLVVDSQPVSFRCPHYAKQGREPTISEDKCKQIQQQRPDLCRAVHCQRLSVEAPKSQAGSAVMVDCLYYGQKITEEQCKDIQENNPNLCKITHCPRFQKIEETRPRGLV